MALSLCIFTKLSRSTINFKTENGSQLITEYYAFTIRVDQVNFLLEKFGVSACSRIITVISIYNRDDPSDPSNYRPISLLSVFNRIFEKMMYYRLKSFLEKENIFNDSQYGYAVGEGPPVLALQWLDNKVVSMICTSTNANDKYRSPVRQELLVCGTNIEELINCSYSTITTAS